ncbi:MAG: hypothetical protein K2K83_01065 [Rikenella sp.]|nr:hypothetical protein [Rikenella sp.]
MYNIGKSGNSWSSSIPSGSNSACSLAFGNSTINLHDYGAHAYGFQLRCLQE